MIAEWIILVILVAATVSANKKSANGDINGAIIQDEIDDFVPFQGERFSIFDWNLFQVNFFESTLNST